MKGTYGLSFPLLGTSTFNKLEIRKGMAVEYDNSLAARKVSGTASMSDTSAVSDVWIIAAPSALRRHIFCLKRSFVFGWFEYIENDWFAKSVAAKLHMLCPFSR